jgi:hypothetical protein
MFKKKKTKLKMKKKSKNIFRSKKTEEWEMFLETRTGCHDFWKVK